MINNKRQWKQIIVVNQTATVKQTEVVTASEMQ